VHASLSGVSDGRIIATVTYDELVQRGGFFAELVQAQFGPPRSQVARMSGAKCGNKLAGWNPRPDVASLIR
jgi:hypothetical protein